MKTPKEKAEILIRTFRVYADMCRYDEKEQQIVKNDSYWHKSTVKCALCAVEEIINDYESIYSGRAQTSGITRQKIAYWNNVKDELIKI